MTLKEKLQLAEQRLPLPELARLLGLEICQRPGTCRSPFREERKPSWAWWFGNDGRGRWMDHASGEAGDCASFVARALGLSNREGVLRYLELSGLTEKDFTFLPVALPKLPAPRPVEPRATKEPPKLPEDIHCGTDEELEELMCSRGWETEHQASGLRQISDLGFLRFGTWQGERAWFLVDPVGRFFEARRMDRKPWRSTGAKSDSRGSKSLLGAERINVHSLVLLVEGAPDFLACALLIAEGGWDNVICLKDAVPVAMLGAGSRLPGHDLAKFKGSRVIILPHLDNAGRKARDTWKAQLREAGAVVGDVNLSRFVHKGGKDLADTFDPFPSEGLALTIQARDENLRSPD